MARKKAQPIGNVVARNRKARHDYFIEQTFEAGVVLAGSEVKALRLGQGSINESYAGGRDGELFLFNAFIPEYKSASGFNHEPRRDRKLLLHKAEIRKLATRIQQRGFTLIPLSIYLKEGKIKVELGLVTGKKHYDKRDAEREKAAAEETRRR